MKPGIACVVCLAVVLVGTVYAAALGESDGVSLSLTTDRRQYSIGEPIRVTLLVTNNTDAPVYGWFYLGQQSGRIAILYRRTGEASFHSFREFGEPVGPDGTKAVWARMRIDANSTERSDVRVLVDPITGKLLLQEPGEYEFVVHCRPWFENPVEVMKSDRVLVRVEPPPDVHREALADYLAKDLPPLVEPWPIPALDIETFRRAMAFLERYPTSLYAPHVKNALLRGIGHRKGRKVATPEETEVLRRLLAERDREGPDR